MPELPEVETTVNSLNILKNKKVINLNVYVKKLRYPIIVSRLKKIINTKVIKFRRISKYIILDFSNSYTVIIHLGMSGTIHYVKNNKTIIETEEVVIATNTLSFEEYVELRLLAFIMFVTNIGLVYDPISKLLIAWFAGIIVPSYNCITKVGSFSPRLGSITNREKFEQTTGASRFFPNSKARPFAPISNAICLFISLSLIPNFPSATLLGT